MTARLELLSQQVHQAHRNAVAAELSARGLGEIGHPMLITILKHLEEGENGCSQRELAQMLHISPPAVATSLKSMEKSDTSAGNRSRGTPAATGFFLRRRDGLQ